MQLTICKMTKIFFPKSETVRHARRMELPHYRTVALLALRRVGATLPRAIVWSNAFPGGLSRITRHSTSRRREPVGSFAVEENPGGWPFDLLRTCSAADSLRSERSCCPKEPLAPAGGVVGLWHNTPIAPWSTKSA